jgi:transposase-like protein
LSLYARGLSTREMQGHLEELYGTDVIFQNKCDRVNEISNSYPSYLDH